MRKLSVLVAALLLQGVVVAAPRADVVNEVTLLVMFEDGVAKEIQEELHARAGADVTGSLPQIAVSRVLVPAPRVELYERSPLVKALQPTRTLRILGPKPNDPLLYLQWPLQQVDAFKAWMIEKGKKDRVKVAVIDTGVDASHADLKRRVIAGFDFRELDEDSYDDHGHGTHVAGIIAANVSNRRGIAGLSHGARIIPMKTCTDRGQCPIFETYAGAIDAVRRGAAIINMSLGGPGMCREIDQAVFDWIRAQGTLAVVAAGNWGADDNPEVMPANCDNTLAVGAVDYRGKRAPFSSYGSFVDIAAPGVEVWSTLPPLVSILSPYIGYGSASGTSMAAPHVAGAAALLKARHPDWSPDQIERKLLSSAIDAGKKGRDDFYGAGILNLYSALK